MPTALPFRVTSINRREESRSPSGQVVAVSLSPCNGDDAAGGFIVVEFSDPGDAIWAFLGCVCDVAISPRPQAVGGQVQDAGAGVSQR